MQYNSAHQLFVSEFKIHNRNLQKQVNWLYSVLFLTLDGFTPPLSNKVQLFQLGAPSVAICSTEGTQH